MNGTALKGQMAFGGDNQEAPKMDFPVRISGVIRQSIVDGPGLRLVLFTQGCPHHCPGCHNPDTHDPEGGYDCPADKILAEFDKNPLLKGITLSGGEPFARPGQLVPLVEEIRRRGKNVWCYTGYTFEALMERAREDEDTGRLCVLIDILVDGPFVEAEKDLTLRFRGSGNQRVLDMQRSLESGGAVEAVLED